ncbi:MAG: alpha-galactosidase [Oscillospiraceae bacterium]|nr:alpha-galactosidase [Oscillospiraceae bacterium]
MPIIYNEKNKTFKLDTDNTSYIIQVYEENYLLNLYYGDFIPDCFVPGRDKRTPNASFSPANPVIGEHGFSPDTAPMEFGTSGAGDFRISALEIRNSNGDSVTDIRYCGHKIYDGKKEIPQMPSSYVNSDSEAQTLELYAKDAVTGATVTLYYSVFPKYDIIARRIRVTNESPKKMRIERAFSLCLDLPDMDYDMISLYGAHAKERNAERRPLAHGIQGIGSRRGASSHTQNPFMALAKKGADEEHGSVYGFNFVYSGNFSALAECDFNCTTRVIMGIDPDTFSWELDGGESFDSPEAIMVYTSRGIGEMSRLLHRFYNNNLIRGRYKTEKRPLLINSWEAAYFNFDSDKLVAFAKEAKKLGVEMLVMDDGWFGKRNDDTSSLGDWFVNEEKLQGSLGDLIKRVNNEGLKFGIWYEPEMISPDSDLYRAHPDWCVHVEGREPMLGRNQYVLDVSRKDVRDNIWEQMYKVLSENNIEYLKWDFNRNICDAGSALLPPERKEEFFHRFILGTYDLMNRLVTAFPNILFENCSGGGGRYDPAMLCYSPQIWASDNTDPIERLYIQFGTSMCYPASSMGAHVSACDRTGYGTKCNVARWGTFGLELDPTKLTDEETEIIRNQIKDYHRNYELVNRGDLYRLISPFENPYRAAWQFVSPDKSRTMFTLVTMRREFRQHLIVKLHGLDPDAYYRNEETGDVFSGALLMNAGLVLTHTAEKSGESVVICFDKI